MTIENFLAAIEEIKSLNPKYQLGHDGDDGYCDCVGMVIGAARRCGETWSGIHGSNWAVRHYTADLHEVFSDSDLNLGDLVYKAREPGDDYYDLPSRYDDDDDKKDYYHIGVVTQLDPLRITHCTKSGLIDGITVDKKRGKWKWAGTFTLIDGNEGAMNMKETAKVVAASGSNVNMRVGPTKTAQLMAKVPVGETVVVNSNNGEWAQIEYDGRTGYMMSMYLQTGDAPVAGASRAEEIRAQVIALLDELVGMTK